MQPLKVVVIGGGAAGFFGAITCAETYPQAQVILLEAGRQPLSKVRISGGGRCNVTHACFDPAGLVQYYPRGGKALRGAFSRFQAKDTVVWFSDRGVQLKTEPDGRMFPITDSSETIVDCLFEAARASGVQIRRGTPVDKIFRQVTSLNQPLDTGFEIQLKSGEILKCDRILLATGSNPQGYRWVKTLGHTIEPPVPSLFTFTISDPRLQDLAGVSVESARLRLGVGKTQLEQIGPLLITHWGLSGPAALKLSAWAARMLHDCNYRTTLQINWLPQYNPEKLREMLLAVKSQLPQRAISTSCPLPLPRRLWQSLIAAVGISGEQRWAELSNKVLNQLIQELSEGKYQIQGKGVFKEEFVTCGGVNLKEVNFKTMESRICPGLYFAGEILDIDGVTGGFNFQSAWTTAYLAGQAMGNEEIKN
ncbi:NAD(P)/FAD-dependent oxidoreductase [Trichocoleus sp. ST-U2]|uniref:NAD(P)/FAD-dependent oxidoreductase n=1 Tax=Coleofasciculus sp. FACHB-SPT9 TaxID=2692791 RepID=UPI0030DC6AF2